jgi:hypothetical protein
VNTSARIAMRDRIAAMFRIVFLLKADSAPPSPCMGESIAGISLLNRV